MGPSKRRDTLNGFFGEIRSPMSGKRSFYRLWKRQRYRSVRLSSIWALVRRLKCRRITSSCSGPGSSFALVDTLN